MKKIVNCLLIIVAMLFISNTSFASETAIDNSDLRTNETIKIAAKVTGENKKNDDLGDLDKYVSENGTELGTLADKVAIVLGTIRVIGVIVSVGALMAIGIKYMISSVEEKAEYKKTFITYVIGAFLLFTVTTLPSLIYNIMHNLET